MEDNGINLKVADQYLRKLNFVRIDTSQNGAEVTGIISNVCGGTTPYIIALTANIFEEGEKKCLDSGLKLSETAFQLVN